MQSQPQQAHPARATPNFMTIQPNANAISSAPLNVNAPVAIQIYSYQWGVLGGLTRAEHMRMIDWAQQQETKSKADVANAPKKGKNDRVMITGSVAVGPALVTYTTNDVNQDVTVSVSVLQTALGTAKVTFDAPFLFNVNVSVCSGTIGLMIQPGVSPSPCELWAFGSFNIIFDASGNFNKKIVDLPWSSS
eukprot:TRINITY_DN381_c0_g1_i1.p1 TRINITY_DN381_c0_g1~~TRINITY_DN381_c0_g1_i1.p1  ORF type:complete len:191 (+),score=34.68 TRINITY_DN381_c0_g1_i1:64-636(+)